MKVDVILLTFLEKKDASPEYKEAVKSLAQQVDRDGQLETDGISPFRDCVMVQSGGGAPIALRRTGRIATRPDPGLDEDLCRTFGAQLAELGDLFEREHLIKPEDVEKLTHDILSNSFTRSRFEEAVQSLLSNVPSGIEPEKASLTVAMLLTRKIGEHVPSLLQRCFFTAKDFIQDNYNSYLESQARQR